MLEKHLDFPGIDPVTGQIFTEVYQPSSSLVKLANEKTYAPDLQKFLSSLKKEPGYIFVVVSALGAGEYWGSNKNHDYFEEKELLSDSPDYGYRSFLNAGVFRHHRNQDKEKSFGQVVFTTYNKKMHRVEIVIRVDKAKARKEGQDALVAQLENGEHVPVSMGARVKFDICSICGHASKTREDYCIHCKNDLGKVYADGRRVCTKNPKPKFFDISFVLIGADRGSFVMEKVASSSAAFYHTKLSTIVKEVPDLSSHLDSLFSGEQPLPDTLLRGLAEQSLPKSLGMLSGAGIMLRPPEFQFLVIAKSSGIPMANMLYRRNIVFRPLGTPSGIDVIDPAAMGIPMSMPNNILLDRSMSAPLLINRLATLNDVHIHDYPSPLGGENELPLSSLYMDYRRQLLNLLSSLPLQGTGFMAKTAQLLPAWAVLLPLIYLYSAHLREAEKKQQPLNPLEKFVANHPIISSSVGAGVGLNANNIKDLILGLASKL